VDHHRRHARRHHPVRLIYRRAIAKQAIERPIADSHPARIEEVVQKVKDETDEAMRRKPPWRSNSGFTICIPRFCGSWGG
jgi:hypothetical protein